VKVKTSPAPGRHELGFHPVTPFVCANAPGTTRKRALVISTASGNDTQSFDLKAEETESRLRLVLIRALSSEFLAFESPANNAGTGHHSGRQTPCAVIPVLHSSSHVGWIFDPCSPGMSKAPAEA